ncbi:hypothetical protein BAOM_2532 [Peribacillus asahii]|uniref:Uncharacterized protein n=1 Tax=Peribacillus asahii TaxID=228899 RepID=A0A3Q9RNG4_9BACI|nr:hypothetical protein BAOM_2532 [Peribacillus asahii]
MVLVQKLQDNIVQWIPKETQLISISVKQGTKGLQSASSRKLCGLFVSLSFELLQSIRIGLIL